MDIVDSREIGRHFPNDVGASLMLFLNKDMVVDFFNKSGNMPVVII